MKCQKCDKPAIFHITEMIDARPLELHLCQKHADEYLHQTGVVPNVDEEFFALKNATDDLMSEDFQICPYCGIGFQDFRKTGRVGCANDYAVFLDRLEPLIFGVHGSTRHVGKRPKRVGGGSDVGATLVRLRNLLADSVETEDYEQASKLRDRIAALEKSLEPSVAEPE